MLDDLLGCLFEFCFEVFGELIVEGISTTVEHFLPSGHLGEKARKRIAAALKITIFLWLIAVIVGLFMIFSDDRIAQPIGKLILIICGIICILFILLCIIFKKKSKKEE